MTERYQQNYEKLNHYKFENFSNLLEDPYYSLKFIPTQNRLMFDITCNSLHFQYSLHTLHLFLHIQILDKNKPHVCDKSTCNSLHNHWHTLRN